MIYNDKTLDGLEPKIDASNPDLAIALSRYDQARQFEAEAAAATYPEIDLGGSFRRTTNPRTGHCVPVGRITMSNTIAGRFTYELDLWGQCAMRWPARKTKRRPSNEDAASLRSASRRSSPMPISACAAWMHRNNYWPRPLQAYASALHLTQSQHNGGIVVRPRSGPGADPV